VRAPGIEQWLLVGNGGVLLEDVATGGEERWILDSELREEREEQRRRLGEVPKEAKPAVDRFKVNKATGKSKKVEEKPMRRVVPGWNANFKRERVKREKIPPGISIPGHPFDAVRLPDVVLFGGEAVEEKALMVNEDWRVANQVAQNAFYHSLVPHEKVHLRLFLLRIVYLIQLIF